MESIQIHPQDKIDKEIVVALGNFDGIHLAHQELIHQAIKIAKKKI
ncbi:riboflavin kinase-like protein [Peptoniphilus sp. oral taxon 375 str. F0436]|nr:riboflavin kinase-like protein [Peptoniphilus sp. oral taxon 375 str. F0436]